MSVETKTTHPLPLGRHLAVLSKMYYGALSKQLEHLEIEKHYSVLVCMENHPEHCTQQFLCDTLKIDKASMVSMVDYLEKKKYLRRAILKDDRRAYRLTLTAKAKRIMPELHQAINSMNRIALKGLTGAESRIFLEALCKISGNLDQVPSTPVVIRYRKIKKSTS